MILMRCRINVNNVENLGVERETYPWGKKKIKKIGIRTNTIWINNGIIQLLDKRNLQTKTTIVRIFFQNCVNLTFRVKFLKTGLRWFLPSWPTCHKSDRKQITCILFSRTYQKKKRRNPGQAYNAHPACEKTGFIHKIWKCQQSTKTKLSPHM